jgi:hypothetical protein
MYHTFQMFLISMMAALLSSMNVWTSSSKHIYLSINDFYMAFLMTGWMFLLEGIIMAHTFYIFMGSLLAILSLYCIRTQFGLTTKQYIQGMIPHHSMAIHMSQQYLQKNNQDSQISELSKSIIKSQEKEIESMVSSLQK